jgi:transposase
MTEATSIDPALKYWTFSSGSGQWRMEKIDSRTLSVEALNERRRRAVKMRLQGTSLKETATQCEMSRTTVIAAGKAYNAGGWSAVDIERPGRPSGVGRTLSTEQEWEVQRLIRDRTPDQLKMVYALWTRQAVAELIRDRFGIVCRCARWVVPVVLGLHAAEADEAGLRAVARSGEEVARRAVSGHRRLRQGRGSRDPLGRRDRSAQR